MSGLIARVILVLSCFGASTAIAQERTTPSCYFEQVVQQALLAALNDPDIRSGAKPPPGQYIDIGPIGDPKYQAPGWEKRAYTEYMRQSLKPLPGEYQRHVQRYVVQMHYMWNQFTRQYDQVKFSTSIAQGCEGKKEIAGAWIEGEAIAGEHIVSYPDQFSIIAGPLFSWGRNAHIFDRQKVGTVTVIQHGVWQWGQGFGTVNGSLSRSGGCPNLCHDTDL